MKCTKLEEKVLSFLLRYYRIFFFLAITLIGLEIRWVGRDFVSADMDYHLLSWFEKIQNLGQWKALGTQVGDYNILYQTLIALGTYLTDKPVLFYKGISVLSDFALAFSCAYAVTRVYKKTFFQHNVFCVVYTLVLLLPTVMLDSAYWGQCDSLYTTCLIWTLYLLYEKKFCPAFLVYGLAFAFKFQSIFLLPFIIILYAVRREFSLLNFVYTLVVFWVSGIGGYLNGRSLLAPFQIYLKQTSGYQSLFLNSESFWKLLCQPTYYDQMGKFTILFTIVLLGLGFYAVLACKPAAFTFREHVRYAAWTVWTLLVFLPSMHERYTYPLDILLLVLAVIEVKCAPFAFFEILISLSTYGRFLFQGPSYEPFFTLLQVALWFVFTVLCYRSLVGHKGDLAEAAASADAPAAR